MRLSSISPDDLTPTGRYLLKVALQAQTVRGLQKRYYAGEKSVLTECKTAERDLDRLMSEPEPDLFSGDDDA